MVDIHCHILPQLDDGAKDLVTSQQMAAMAQSDGITHIVATPHSNYQYKFDAGVNAQKRDELQQTIGGSPAILLGCDFHLSFENLEDIRVNPERYTLNGKQYLLVEFADISIPPHMDQIFFDLLGRRLNPIITHPERNPILSRQPEQIRKWVDQGCFVQVTAASFLGRFGKQAEQLSHILVKHGLVHFIATDAHNTISRPPVLSEAREALKTLYGEKLADALTELNPRAAIEGRQLPWQPPTLPIKAKRWFSFGR
ncbi:MAG: hypothetical protein A3F68_12755 [Acidobacteria bacterium RIFCSPLOWO2_12_FULL_54_10]|nr:MAG: hypothetical protein A3F68_12755 [Acidobacteria bacterium RIFCSPLOWO2_12_FULL_54_10]